jgi:hypothetical protein
VTGEEGGQYGYDDYWDADGVFRYYGAGQIGPLEFVRGNRALRDHAEKGEDVHVFEQVQPSGLRYEGQFVCAGYYERDDVPDRNGDLRRAIVFELVALDDERAPGAGAAEQPGPTRAGRCRSTSSATARREPSAITRTRARQSGARTSAAKTCAYTFDVEPTGDVRGARRRHRS